MMRGFAFRANLWGRTDSLSANRAGSIAATTLFLQDLHIFLHDFNLSLFAPLADELLEQKGKNEMLKQLRRWFFTGLLVTVPTGLTIWLFWWAWTAVDTFAKTFLHGNFYERVPGAGAVTVLVALMLVGASATSWLGSRLVNLNEWLFLKVPAVGTVFKTIKDMSAMVLDEKSTIFREVVLFEYPRKGLWTLGFVAAPSANEIKEKTSSDDSIAIFVSTTPNPTSGVLVFVSRADCITLDMTAEDGLMLVMSGGLMTPEKAQALQHKIEQEGKSA